MTPDSDRLVPVFMPSLTAVLLNSEDKKGEPLTYDEVIRLRDAAPCIMMTSADVRKMDESRGRDIDPENCWFEWQLLRRELGRKPDLDPGPRFNQIASGDPEYQQTIRDARSSLSQFRAMLPPDASPRRNAMIKTEIAEAGQRSFLWLCNARLSETGFAAEFFEIPKSFQGFRIGGLIKVEEDTILDWMVNDNGLLYGGFSLRYQRSKLPAEEQAGYDEYIGVNKYA